MDLTSNFQRPADCNPISGTSNASQPHGAHLDIQKNQASLLSVAEDELQDLLQDIDAPERFIKKVLSRPLKVTRPIAGPLPLAGLEAAISLQHLPDD
jgi:hypothetical protein